MSVTVIPGSTQIAAGGDGLSKVSTVNSSSTVLTAATSLVFTGEWEDVSAFPSLTVAVETDQDGVFSIEFSPDGVNQDSTLTRYYTIGQIHPPHRFTVTRKYARVVFTTAVDQTYFRLQTLLGAQIELNAPCDSTVSQDFDATVVRPTNYNAEVALGRRQGATLWNKFGYNLDVDTAIPEVVASWGGAFTPLLTATTISIVSTSTADDDGSTGCNSVVLYGLDANRDEVIEVVTLNGTTPVVTTSTWLGLNRVAMFLCGTGMVNAGTITATAVTGSTTMAQMPVGEGVTQQCIFHVPRNHHYIMEWLTINVLNRAKDAELTIKVWVYSTVNNGKQVVYSEDIDTSKTNDITESPPLPFPVDGNSVIWIEATTDKNDIIVNGRFSGILVRDADA